MAQPDVAGPLSWLLVGQVEDVLQALILSRDGLVVATSQNMTRADGDHLSALAAGVQSLGRGAANHFGGGEVRQTIIEMESAFLFVMAAGQGTCLALLSSASANVGVMAYEMAMLVRRMGKHLSAPPRFSGAEPHRVNGHDRPEGQVAGPRGGPGGTAVHGDQGPDRARPGYSRGADRCGSGGGRAAAAERGPAGP